ncbi:MAG: xylulokinase [Planctomycetaceae bacterium]|nr:xylulokinase [Planctomycetaceae bacterium]
MQYLLAHDLGTSGNKATLFSEEGQLVASETISYRTNYFNRTWAEQNPSDWWDAICQSSQNLLAHAKVDPASIAVVALSGQMMGCTCVDRNGNPLRPSILYCDQRSEKEAAKIIEKISMADAYKIVGHRIAAVYALEKLMWVKANEPDIYRQTAMTLCAKDYVNFRLTGTFATDFSDASGTNAFDINTMQWSDTMIEAAGVKRSMFPDAFDSTKVLGEITREAATATGLKPGTPVCIGGGDGSCAGVGVGCIKPGTAYNYLGSSSWVALTVKEPIVDPLMRTMNWAHVVPGYLHPSGSVQTAGAAYQWLKEKICTEEMVRAEQLGHNVYEIMNSLLMESPPGANGLIFLPYLLGERSPRWNPDARGAFLGLTLATTRSDIVRSVMEGITYNLGLIVDIFRKELSVGVPTVPMETMTIIGGGAKSSIWLQMMADIYDVKVQRPNFLEEATSMGAAVVGGVGVGLFPDFETIDRFIRIEETIEPNRENQTHYAKMKPLFDKAYFALVDLFADMSKI